MILFSPLEGIGLVVLRLLFGVFLLLVDFGLCVGCFQSVNQAWCRCVFGLFS
jgi:hypothetical protein